MLKSPPAYPVGALAFVGIWEQSVRQPAILQNRWWTVVGSLLGMVVGNTPVVIFTFGIFLKPIIVDLGWDRSAFAAGILGFQLASAASLPFMGTLVDRFGVRRVTIVCTAVFALALASLSQMHSWAAFLSLCTISGVAGAGRGPVAYAKAIFRAFDSGRGLALGIAMTGLGIGGALMPQLARWLIEDFGWRRAYLGLAAVTFLVAVPTLAIMIPDSERRTDLEVVLKPAKGSGAIIRSMQFWLLISILFLVASCLTGTLAHVVPLLTDRGVSVKFASLVLSFAAVAMMGGQIFSGHLLDRLPARHVASFLCPLALAGIGLLSVGTGPLAPAIGSALLAIGLGAEGNVGAFLVSRYFGLQRFGGIYGWVIGASVLGNGFGPWIMALCHDFTNSYSAALAGFGLALILATLLIFKLEPSPYSTPAAEAAHR
jgi:MFS family permease